MPATIVSPATNDWLGIACAATRVILEGNTEDGDDIVSIDYILEKIGWRQTPEMSLLLWLIQELRANPNIAMVDDEYIEFSWREDLRSSDEVLNAMAPEYAQCDPPGEIVKRVLDRYHRSTDCELVDPDVVADELKKPGCPRMTLGPDTMSYLAKVRGVLDRHPDFLPSAPAVPATQAVVDEIAAADPAEIATIFGVDHFAAHWFIKRIGKRTLGVPDPDRGHEVLSPDTMSYLREVREKLDEIDEVRAFGSMPIVSAPHEGVFDEIKGADPAVIADILYIPMQAVPGFAENVSTTPLPTPEEQEERLRRLHDAIELHERQINPWRFDEVGLATSRLVRRAFVHVAEDYSTGYDHLEVGGITDPSLADQVVALHPDQVRGVCIELARWTANAEVNIHRADHDDEEAVFLAVAEYRAGPE